MARNTIPLIRRVTYFPVLTQICKKKIGAGIMLSQALYWTQHTKNPDGWFWKDADEWEYETSLTREQQENARRVLKECGFLQDNVAGLPPVLHFRVVREAILRALVQFAQDGRVKSKGLTRLISEIEPALLGGKFELELFNSAKTNKEAMITSNITQKITAEIISGFEIPIGNGDFLVEPELLEKWVRLFPGVEVQQELRNMISWLLGKPGHLRTKNDALSFVNRWLTNEQRLVLSSSREKTASDPRPLRYAHVLPTGLVRTTAWDETLSRISAKLNKHSFSTWFEPVRCAGAVGEKLILLIPTEEFSHLAVKYAELITQSLPDPFTSVELIAPTKVQPE